MKTQKPNRCLLYGGMVLLALTLYANAIGYSIPHFINEGDFEMSRNHYLIGQNITNGKDICLSPKSLRLHSLAVGGTGRGKSKMLENRIRYHLKNKQGLMLLDPHGTLYDDILAYATRYGYKNWLALINANDTRFSPGLNFLARNQMDISAHASQVMRGIAKTFGESDSEVKPRLERWQRNLLMTLIESHLTLGDALDFLSIANPLFRQAALGNINNSYVRREWEGFEAVKSYSDKVNLIEAPLNRAAKMILSDPIRRIVGQQTSTIDIGEAIENGKIVLVNLAPLKVSRECQQILGILLVDQVINYAFQRSKQQAKKKPFFVIVDEAAEFTSDDLPYSLQALRKFGIHLFLCYQNLAQIRKIPGYYENVMTNCDIKIAFKSNREDSEELVEELFAGKISGDFIKDELYHRIILPEESTREIIVNTESQSESHGESISKGDSVGSSSGFGSSSGSAIGHADHLIPSSGVLSSDGNMSYTDSSSLSLASSNFDMNSSASFSGRSDSRSTAKSTGQSRSVVPFYEFIRDEELSNRTYYTIEEIKERYIAWVMCQPMRHAYIKINDDDPIPILTTLVEDVRAREKDKQRVIDRSNAKYALPAKEVDRLIEARRIALLEQPKIKAQEIEEEIENARWQ